MFVISEIHITSQKKYHYYPDNLAIMASEQLSQNSPHLTSNLLIHYLAKMTIITCHSDD